ncbi:hypothetical protein SPI_06786 [Niveomyces insectorum RCEF 264]|uniref:Uncharacterized protein n=1 Tax=Niveomyces insectorum RCEF 264 TaxID=1081102 RepID=A0A167QRP6_9HYPO|nr:hypothetical protein SPI_06786 [Niveomyces insectorum RCEF 264]
MALHDNDNNNNNNNNNKINTTQTEKRGAKDGPCKHNASLPGRLHFGPKVKKRGGECTCEF